MKYIRIIILILTLGASVPGLSQGFDPTPPDDPQTPVFPEIPVEPVKYGLSVVAQNPLAAYVSGAGQYEVGTAVRISTSARSAKYTFMYWLSGGDIISRNASFIYITTDKDATLTAVYDFTPNTPEDPQTVVIHKKHVLNLICEPADIAAFNRVSGDIVREGTSVALNTWGNQNYVFQGWYFDDVLISNNAAFNYVMPDADVTLIARFEYQEPPAPPPFDPETPGDPMVEWHDNESITIQAHNITMTYGDPMPRLTFSSGGVLFHGSPELSCEATSSSPIGTYPIIISRGTVVNEKATFIGATLTIEKAPLIIRADDIEIIKGDDLPKPTYTIKGFRNDDSEKDIVLPTIRCHAIDNTIVGSYPITFSGGEAQNYDIRYVNGTLTIGYAPVKIIANDATMTYGDKVPTLTYTSEGADFEGTPSLRCSATSASTVGTYPITIEQGSMDNINTTFVVGTLTIKKAPLTIRVKDTERFLNETNPEFELSFEGFRNDDTEADITLPTINCEANESSALGTYPITLSGGEATNYDITLVNGTLNVVYAPVTITANDITITYGDEVPELTYSSDGAAFGGTPMLSCEATSTSPAGIYPIMIELGSIDNTNTTLVAGTLTIKKAPLTITVKDAERFQYDANPEFMLLFEGFRNGDTEADITLPDVLCEANEQSAVGTYPITLSGGEASNYDLKFVNGTLTVSYAPITITANDITMTYGDEVPELTYTSEGAIFEGTPKLVCEATSATPVGIYPILVEQGSVDNTNATFVAGTLTITKASLTITVKDAEREEGLENPQFELMFEGFRNGDSETDITLPEVICEADEASVPGTYTIELSGGEALNYELTLVPGILTVTMRDGIASLSEGKRNPDAVYDLSGRKVSDGSRVQGFKGSKVLGSRLSKGIYIIGGKKRFIIKK